jgi:predicted nucleic acid-binding Zn ribbon protein
MECPTCGATVENDTFTCPTCGRDLEPTEHDYKATASLALGLVGMFAWFLLLVGLPITVAGLILGVKSKHPSRGIALIGIILCVVGMVVSVVNAIIDFF